MRRMSILAVMLACVPAASVTAQERAGNAREVTQDNAQIVKDEDVLARDQKELAAFDAKLVRFDELRSVAGFAELAMLSSEFDQLIATELQQAKLKVGAAEHELHLSSREVRRDRRERRTDRRKLR